MKTILAPIPFIAEKFVIRYNLPNFKGVSPDVWVDGGTGLLHYPDSVPDNPIFDPPDPFVPVPTGIKLHHWQELVGWIGINKVLAPETDGPHHECYYIVADTQADLDTLQVNPLVAMQEGQPAYVKDKKAIVVWDGTKWK
jgi:hypothetical protein